MTGPPPDRALVVNQPPKPGMPVRRTHIASAEFTLPKRPEAISLLSAAASGRALLQKSNRRRLFAFSAAFAMAAASFAFSAGGFSQNTCLPAFSASIASGAWKRFGVITETASSVSPASMSVSDAYIFLTPHFSAHFAAAAALGSATATTSAPPFLNPGMW